ncbi:MAG: DNA polymerase III subunit epsilon [Alphaproteobacteria bacterium]
MREIVLDTETTGLDPYQGHRIVEIGALELVNFVPTGRHFHQYINPERDMPEDAFRVHGLSNDFLCGHPVFRDICEAFLEFIGESALVIHNAEFDMKFINAELETAGRSALPPDRAVDTLLIARSKYPGAPASLDALCRRFNVDNSARDLHGALVDADLLARVYMELMGGRQPGLVLGEEESGEGTVRSLSARRPPRPEVLPPRVSDEDRAAHRDFLEKFVSGEPLWQSVRRKRA